MINSVPEITMVTCFYNLSRLHGGCLPTEKLLERFDGVLKLPIYLVIYTEGEFYDLVEKKRREYGFHDITLVVNEKIEDLWSFQFLGKVNENRLLYWPSRDSRTCSESHLLVCNKCDFVLKTIHLNPFKTKKFGWIDSLLTIDGKLRICENYTMDKVITLLNSVTEKFHLQILNVNDKKFKLDENKRDYYSSYKYVMCGCLFTCGISIGISILNRIKEIFIRTTELGYGHGEEMLFLEILDEFYDEIERGYGDYGQIINNLVEPTVNLHYVNYYIIERYLQFKYHKECYDCCKKIILSFHKKLDNQEKDIDWNIYVKIYLNYYLSAYYYNRCEALLIVTKFIELTNTNAFIKNAFENNGPTHWMQQFEFVLPKKKCNETKKNNIIFLVFGCATIQKYKDEIIKINETWGKKAEQLGLKVLFFLGEEKTDLIDDLKYIYLNGVSNDYLSASYKQNIGLKYIHENFDYDFVFVCGTDTYVNLENFVQYINQFDSQTDYYIGGHGDIRKVGNTDVYFHSGAGFCLSKSMLSKLYNLLPNITDDWFNVCNENNVGYLKSACDVSIAYFLQKLMSNHNSQYIVKSNHFYACNFKGYAYNNTHLCCGDKVDKKSIILCHYMTLDDFDEYTVEINSNKILSID
jgi:hypothetical protein